MSANNNPKPEESASTESLNGATKPKSNRSLLFHLHFWIGWITAIPILLVCISGGVLAFEKYIRPLEFPEQFDLEPTDNPMDIDEVLHALRNEEPRLIVHHLGLPKSPRHAYGAYSTEIDQDGNKVGGGFFILNQYTGEKIRSADKFTITGLMTELHRRLAAGKVGHQVVAISSLILAITCVFGLLLWWPMRGKTFVRALKKGRVLDWHNALGVISMGPLIIMALTGVIMSYSNPIFSFLEKFQGAPAEPPSPVAEYQEGESKQSVQAAFENVKKSFPEGLVTGVQPTGSASSPYKFFVTEGDLRYTVWMNPYTSTEITRYDGKASNWVGKFKQSYFRFHTLAFNPVAASVWGVFSTVGGILVLTGIWISIRRWKRG